MVRRVQVEHIAGRRNRAISVSSSVGTMGRVGESAGRSRPHTGRHGAGQTGHDVTPVYLPVDMVLPHMLGRIVRTTTSDTHEMFVMVLKSLVADKSRIGRGDSSCVLFPPRTTVRPCLSLNTVVPADPVEFIPPVP